MTLGRRQKGMTLVELVIALAVAGIVLTGLLIILVSQIRLPVKILGEIKASSQIRKATLLLTEDVNSAQTFAAGTNPDYGTFTWSELSGVTAVPISVRYYWGDEKVFRVHDRGGAVSPPTVVLEPVLQYSDVSFQFTPPQWEYVYVTKTWNYTEGKAQIDVKVTEERGSVFSPAIATATIIGDLRPQIDRPAALPGRVPPQPPPANQVDFFVAGNPTLIQGTLRSGSGADLKFDDANYYVVRATGSPRTAIWEVTSEAIDYTTISDVTLEFVGQSDGAGVLQEFFVYNPTDPAHTSGGYDTSPDHAEPYSAANTDQRMLFSMDPADINYVNSLTTKVIKLKIKASASFPFDLSADKLIFRVAGTPASTFSRDFVVEELPSIEVGSYVSGTVASLATDDTSYYSVRQSGGTLQWVAVSQPITLDTISSIEVIFTARSTRSGTVQSLYVYNPAYGGDGYPVTPSNQLTYDAANADRTVSFFLSASDVSYVNSLFPKEIRLRVKATHTSLFDLEADRLVFRVKP